MKRKSINHLNTQTATLKSSAQDISPGIFEKISIFISKRENLFLYFCLFLTAISSFFMFDIKVDANGDDSYNILAADLFLKNGSYPGYHGPVYPFYLAFIMLFFGMKIWILKIFTAVLLLVHHYFIFKTFSRHFKNFTFYIVFLLICINPALIQHAQITMSETLFITILSILFYYFDRHFLLSNITENSKTRDRWIKMLILSTLLFLLYHCRYIGIVALPAIGFYFIWEFYRTKKVKTLLEFLATVLIVFIVTTLIKWLYFNIDIFASSSQFEALMQKNAYRDELGKETLSGFIDRFLENSDFYIGSALVRFFGFEPITSPIFKVFFYGIFLYTLYQNFKKKNQVLLYTGIFCVLGLVLSCFILQAFWKQDRIILIYMPFMLLSLSLTLIKIFKKENTLNTYLINFFLSGTLLISGSNAINMMRDNHDIFKESIKGNNLYGLTKDQENYARACIYASKNVPEDSKIWCRKPHIAGVYGQNSVKFKGLFKVSSLLLEKAFPDIKSSTPQTRIILKYNDIIKAPGLFNWIRQHIHTIMYGDRKDNTNEEDNMIYIAYKSFSKQDQETVISYLKQGSIPFETDIKKFSEKFLNLTITDPDQMLNQLKRGGNYIIKANLRLNSKVNNGYTINTISRFLQSVVIKYPTILKLEKTIGESEQAYLYKINYPKDKKIK